MTSLLPPRPASLCLPHAEDLQWATEVCPSSQSRGALQGDVCTSCGMPFVRSFLTFEHLPVVEFHLAPGITDAEVGVYRVSVSTCVGRVKGLQRASSVW